MKYKELLGLEPVDRSEMALIVGGMGNGPCGDDQQFSGCIFIKPTVEVGQGQCLGSIGDETYLARAVDRSPALYVDYSVSC